MTDDLPISSKLALMFVVMRGGKATEKELWDDYCKWYEEFGEPTEEKVDKFIQDNKLELDLGSAASSNKANKGVCIRGHTNGSQISLHLGWIG